MDLSDLGSLGDLAKQMENAYSEGTKAMSQAGKEVAKDIKPDYKIVADVKASAKVEGHNYNVDATITFNIELESVLQAANSPLGDLSSILDGIDTNLGDNKDAVIEQLKQPRAIGVVKNIKLRKLDLFNNKGKVKAELNKDGTLLATIKDGKILINFESVLSYPKHSDVYVAIPTMEKMQKNIVVNIKNIESKIDFSWTEKDKDNLKVSGSLKFSKI